MSEPELSLDEKPVVKPVEVPMKELKAVAEDNELSVAFTCLVVKTCAVSTEARMARGAGYCARCSRLVKPDLYIPKE